MTGYVAGARLVDVGQLVEGSVATQSVDPPDVKVTVPVAPAANPDTESVSLVPYGTLAGAAASVSVGVALVTVKLAPFAVVAT